MKKTDIEKNKALKLAGRLKAAGTPERFGAGSAGPDRREQRRLDQAAGLVAYPVKLKQETIQSLRERAQHEGIPENELLNRLLADALKA